MNFFFYTTKTMPETSLASFLPDYESMLAAGMHYGRKRTVFHPKMEQFVYAQRETIHIFDLLKTRKSLEQASVFLKNIKDNGGAILWVASTAQSSDKIREVATTLNMPYVANRWLGGTLTNFKTIRSRVDYYQQLSARLEKEEERAKIIKKELVKLEKELRDLKEKFEGLRGLAQLPEVIFITSLREGKLAAKEARRSGVKSVAVVNTESDPTLVDYPIPANDNARSSIELILDTVLKGITA